MTRAATQPRLSVEDRSPTALAPDPAQLCEQHIPVVHHEVARILPRLPRQVARDDLVSAGLAALAAAAQSFDPTLGVPFARFAARRIQGALLDELRGADWASRSVRAKARAREAAYDALAARLQRTPTAAEVAAYLDVDVAEVEAAEHDVARAVVLSYQAVAGEGSPEDVLPPGSETPEAELLRREREAYLLDAVQVLPDRLRRVVVGYFFEECPMRDLADELGVTESRISQMRAQALELLRDGLNAQLDSDAAPVEPSGVVGRRRAAYYAAIAARSDFRTRLSLPQQKTSEPVVEDTSRAPQQRTSVA